MLNIFSIAKKSSADKYQIVVRTNIVKYLLEKKSITRKNIKEYLKQLE